MVDAPNRPYGGRSGDTGVVEPKRGCQDDCSEPLATAKDFSDETICVGDEVFFTGLFTEVEGDKRLMSIVRHGNIAMLPDEQIQTELGFADVYLIEARSIGGISGAPVFARPTLRIPVDWKDGVKINLQGVAEEVKLLGLMHGHWAILESEINNPRITHDRQRGVNLGIGIVVPAVKILETINQPEVVNCGKNWLKCLVGGMFLVWIRRGHIEKVTNHKKSPAINLSLR